MARRKLLGLISASIAMVICALAFVPGTSAKAGFIGTWQVTVTYPDGPNRHNQSTHTLMLNVSPRGGSLVGRMLITDDQGNVFGGVWRQVGKKIFVTFELPCDPSSSIPCGTIDMLGKVKAKKGKLVGKKLIVMWDRPNNQNQALYDTSNGSFSGIQLSQ